MSFVHSKQTRILVNDVVASGKLRNMTAANTRALGDTTTYLDEGMRFIPGLRSGNLSLEGLFEDSTLQDELEAADGVNNAMVVSVAPAGFAHGMPVLFGAGDLSSNSVTAPVGDVVSMSLETVADELIDVGNSLHDVTAETASGTSSTFDAGTSSSNGGVAVLHVTSASASDTLDVKIQDSTNNSVWADLGTFAQATNNSAQRVTVSGTVDRYVRAIWTVAGTSASFEFATAFARR